METVRKSKKRGVTLIEVVIGIGIVVLLMGYAFIKYQRMRYKNAIDSDKIKVSITVNNANVVSTVLPKGVTPVPRYLKFVKGGIMVLESSGKLEIDSGFNKSILKVDGSDVSIIFNCQDKKPVISTCPIAVFYPGSGVITAEEDESIPSLTDLENQSTRNSKGFIKFTKGAPEKPFTVYTFDEKGIARYRMKFSDGEVMKASIYKYIGPTTGSSAWKRDNVASKNPNQDIEETPDWKKDDASRLPLKIEIK